MEAEDYKVLFDALFEGVYVIDRERRIVYWNKAAKRITGFSESDVIGRFCYDNLLSHIDNYGHMLCQDGCPLAQTLEDGKTRSLKGYLQHKRGHRVPVKIKALPISEPDGTISATIEMFVEDEDSGFDVSAFKHRDMGTLRDALTALPNRRYVDYYLNSKMHDYRMLKINFGLILAEVNFKDVVRDPDAVRICLADSFRGSFRLADLTGCWSEDVFVFIFVGIKDTALKELCDKVAFISKHSCLRQGNMQFSISIGGALVKNSDVVDSLTARAYSNLEQARKQGENQCVVDVSSGDID